MATEKPGPEQRRLLGLKTESLHQKLWQPEGQRHAEYLMVARGLSIETVQRFQLGAVVDPAESDNPAELGRISIPYLRPRGPVGIRYRAIDEGVQPKYYQPPASYTPIFNTQAIIDRPEWLVICEGEVDTMTASQAGMPAIGFPGVNSWRDMYATLLAGFEKIYILADNDDKGQGGSFAETIIKAVPRARMRLLPEGHDVNSLYLEAGAEAIQDLLGRRK